MLSMLSAQNKPLVLSVNMLNAFILSVIQSDTNKTSMLNAVMLNVCMPSDNMLSVRYAKCHK